MRLFFFFCLSLIILSCKKNNDLGPVDDNELITAVELEFQNSATKKFTVKALDKDGDGIFELIEPITLQKNSIYELKVSAYDDSQLARVDVTKGIEEESDVHLFVYKIQPAQLGIVEITDKDKNGLPFGQLAKLTTKNISSSETDKAYFNVILKHQPPVNGKPVKNGDPSLGSSDIDISFDLIIK